MKDLIYCQKFGVAGIFWSELVHIYVDNLGIIMKYRLVTSNIDYVDYDTDG